MNPSKLIYPIILILSFQNLSSKLSNFNINLDETTVSGISSGGYMAVQFHYSFSKHIKGASIFAAGPYFCAGGNASIALTSCMSTPLTISVPLLKLAAETHSKLGYIDNLENLINSRIYLYSGISDTVVKQDVVKKSQEMYREFGANVKTQYSINSEHCYPTNSKGHTCLNLGYPYINNCNYDGAFESMNFLLGGGIKNDKLSKVENLFEFDQTYYASFGSGLNSIAYIYIPDSCRKGEKCKLHVAFHGCKQTLEHIGKEFIELTGLNDIAESNDIIILYPQIQKSIVNPEGCWDWWGYTTGPIPVPTYSTKLGVQNASVWKMVKDLVGI